jgi:hypothetical protein
MKHRGKTHRADRLRKERAVTVRRARRTRRLETLQETAETRGEFVQLASYVRASEPQPPALPGHVCLVFDFAAGSEWMRWRELRRRAFTMR